MLLPSYTTTMNKIWFKNNNQKNVNIKQWTYSQLVQISVRLSNVNLIAVFLSVNVDLIVDRTYVSTII